jgi:hypothetical protein
MSNFYLFRLAPSKITIQKLMSKIYCKSRKPHGSVNICRKQLYLRALGANPAQVPMGATGAGATGGEPKRAQGELRSWVGAVTSILGALESELHG